MSETKEKALEIYLVGDDRALQRRIRNALAHGIVHQSPWSKRHDLLCTTLVKYLVVLEFKSLRPDMEELWENCSNQLNTTAPLLYFPNVRESDKQMLTYFKLFLEGLGASVFVGQTGKESLIDYLCQASQRDPSEIITSMKLSDEGLTIAFADNATATISFPALKRLAETDELLLNEVRIGGDRSYIMIGARNGEHVPIPHDVLREYVVPDTRRKRKARRERRLTARNLGVHVKGLREKAGVSQGDLAAKAGTSRWTIMRIEKGEYLPKVAMMESLAHALGKRLEDLLVS